MIWNDKSILTILENQTESIKNLSEAVSTLTGGIKRLDDKQKALSIEIDSMNTFFMDLLNKVDTYQKKVDDKVLSLEKGISDIADFNVKQYENLNFKVKDMESKICQDLSGIVLLETEKMNKAISKMGEEIEVYKEKVNKRDSSLEVKIGEFNDSIASEHRSIDYKLRTIELKLQEEMELAFRGALITLDRRLVEFGENKTIVSGLLKKIAKMEGPSVPA